MFHAEADGDFVAFDISIIWVDWYDDTFARSGSDVLARAKSVHALGGERKESPLPENESFDPPEPIRLGYPRKEVSGPTPS
jgi:hypothetical protein